MILALLNCACAAPLGCVPLIDVSHVNQNLDACLLLASGLSKCSDRLMLACVLQGLEGFAASAAASCLWFIYRALVMTVHDCTKIL